ncbi:uncharacterized protein LOC132195626 [Neocloeon triangulifer]|uniref:uncharacterized protein LOC132195626 n=1 Tax=Neocloeon triangulifer TaxID=2078957 RepID=UPI00286F4779|nr:uncharacterized protein LOC132195626 [Neocloeon triangulifer]
MANELEEALERHYWEDELYGARERKLKALEKGEGTDCVFVVGRDDSEVEEFYGNKFDLRAASEYFEVLFRSPLTPPGPIRVKHVEPRIFRMVIEFAHCHKLFKHPANLEEAVLLARSADEFLMTELDIVCKTCISVFLKVDQVWKIYEMNNLCHLVAKSCQEFLCNKTLACLNHPTFLEIKTDTLISFLACGGKMNINSEADLVQACLNLANTKNSDDEKRLLIRSALPHLRLLTLDEGQISALSDFLTDEEKSFLVFKKQPKLSPLFPTGPSAPERICQIKTSRCGVKTFTLRPDPKPLRLRETLQTENRMEVGDQECFTISFEASKFMVIRGFDIFCKMNDPPKTVFIDLTDDQNFLYLDSYAKCFAYDKNLDVSIKVRSCDLKFSGAKLSLAPTTLRPFVTNSWVHFNLNVLVPEGGTFEMSVTLKESCYYRFDKPLNVVETEIPKWNDPDSLKLFKNIKFSDLFFNTDDKLIEAPRHQSLTVVRKLYYTLI